MSIDNAREGRRLTNLFGLLTRQKPVVGTTPADVVHAENKWRLLRYRARPEGIAYRTPILLVPSLINRHYVLDLQPGKSFAEFMVAQGHDVFVIDWGTPTDEDRFVTFDDVCDRYLGRAVRRAASFSGRNQVHVLGYCMGGTLATIHAAARPEHVASLTALAAPIGFHDDGLLSTWVRSPQFNVDALVDGFGNVPWQLMQGAFQLLRPTLSLSKAVHLIDRAWDDEFLDGFLALETWGSDNVSFPGECYRGYIRGLYQGDGLLRGTFGMSGRPVRLDAIKCPTLAITFEHDNIVPWRSAAVLLERVGATDREQFHLPGGHVGAVVSRKASQTLWPRISGWWAARDGALQHSAPVEETQSPAPRASVRPPASSKRGRATVGR